VVLDGLHSPTFHYNQNGEKVQEESPEEVMSRAKYILEELKELSNDFVDYRLVYQGPLPLKDMQGREKLSYNCNFTFTPQINPTSKIIDQMRAAKEVQAQSFRKPGFIVQQRHKDLVISP
jgi:hypothetical protein